MDTLTRPTPEDLKPFWERYYDHEFTYNEYPHKSFWRDDFDANDYTRALTALGAETNGHDSLLFVNIPFCHRQCLFCICYTHVTQDYARIQQYLKTLDQEFALLNDLCEGHSIDLRIREIHIGGGTPTLLQSEDNDRLFARLNQLSPPMLRTQCSLEVDPRSVTVADLEDYRERGVDRLSFGVQDFDPVVQKAIGRVQPVTLLKELLQPSLRSQFDGINFDVLCGLPHQTETSFQSTVEQTIDFMPERIMLMFLNYCPDLKTHQRAMDAQALPSLEAKQDWFHQAVECLLEAGYCRIGLDHFALPNDPLAQAYQKKGIHWNSLGYRAGDCVNMIGIGAGSLGRVTDDYYVQNTIALKDYTDAINQGRLPIGRGIRLTPEDQVRRAVVHSLRCYNEVDFGMIEDTYTIDRQTFFATTWQRLQALEADGLVRMENDVLTVTELGKPFIATVCGLFDAYL